MPNNPAYVTNRYTAYLELEVPGPIGPIKQRVPIESFSSGFSRNAIPRARVEVNVGRNVDYNAGDLRGESPIHTLRDNIIEGKTPARVYAKFERLSVDKAGNNSLVRRNFPLNEFLLFDGRVSGFSEGANESSTFVLELKHFVAELTVGSAISPSSHPSNPSNLAFPSVFANPTGAGGNVDPAGDTSAFQSSLARRYLDQEAVLADLWTGIDGFNPVEGFPEGKGIRGFFRKLAESDNIEQILLDIDTPLSQGPNEAALEVFKRFEPLATEPGYLAGSRIGLDAETFPELNVVALLMADRLGKDGPLEMANRTFWDQLIDYAQSFMFSVIPLIDRVITVPYTPALRSVRETIFMFEIDAIGLSYDDFADLRGVGVYGGYGFQADGAVDGADGAVTNRVGGYYLNPKNADGEFKLVQAPDWLRNIPSSADPRPSTAAAGTVVPTVSSPEAVPLFNSAIGGVAGAAAAAGTNRLGAGIRLMDKYAKAIYAAETFANRTIQLQTYFRLDLCPGSIVHIEVPRDKIIKGQRATAVYGAIQSVSFSLDAKSGTASTVYTISDLRTQEEQFGDDGLTLTSHPLYKQVWDGGPMLNFSAPPP